MIRLLFLYLILYSCTETKIEELPVDSFNSSTVEESLSSCFNEISMSTGACLSSKKGARDVIVNNACSDQRKSAKVTFQCKVISCDSGYYLFNNECIPKNCSLNESVLISCKDEIRGSSKAEREFKCDPFSNNLKIASNCLLNECASGYYRSENFCLPSICEPGSIEKRSCSNQVFNSAEAYISRVCDFEGGTYNDSKCTVNACAPGYMLKNNQCIKEVCQPHSIETNKCFVENAVVAEYESICNNDGSAKTYSACTTKSCKPGFELENNRCVPKTCVPNQVREVSCVGEKANSLLASYTESCDSNGEKLSHTACIVKQCKIAVPNTPDFYLSNNACLQKACVPNSKIYKDCSSTIPNSIEANMMWSCNQAGTEMVSSNVCGNIKCASGHWLDGKTCKPLVCNKGVVRTETCTATNASEAIKNFTCSEDEVSEMAGQCTINSCNEGYYLDGNICKPLSCNKGAVRIEACSAENASDAIKDFTCSEDEVSETAGECTIKSCNEGYELSDNSCKLLACNKGAVRSVSCNAENASNAIKNFTCSEDGKSETAGDCNIQECNEYFELKDNKCKDLRYLLYYYL